LFLVGLAVVIGCGPSGRYPVSGTVTLDGSPVPEGDIIFTDPEKKIGPDGGKIKGSKFDLLVKPGKKRVEIWATRMQKLPPGRTGALGETEMPMDYIPRQYNLESELTAEVTPGSPNVYEFKLTSKNPKAK
jgi:hypothetical protein